MPLAWSAEVDRFECSDEAGELVIIVVRQSLVERDSGSSSHIVHGPLKYATVDGREVERVDPRTFRIAGSGSLLRR